MERCEGKTEGEGTADAFGFLLTFKAIVKLREVTVLWLLVTDDPVVGDVAVGTGGRLPLQDDLR